MPDMFPLSLAKAMIEPENVIGADRDAEPHLDQARPRDVARSPMPKACGA